MWSPLWSILVCKIPQFWKKVPIWTTHHTFLESRNPEITKNSYYVLSSKAKAKKGISSSRLMTVLKSGKFSLTWGITSQAITLLCLGEVGRGGGGGGGTFACSKFTCKLYLNGLWYDPETYWLFLTFTRDYFAEKKKLKKY